MFDEIGRFKGDRLYLLTTGKVQSRLEGKTHTQDPSPTNLPLFSDENIAGHDSVPE